jgi:hypothetical protein
MPSRYYSAIAQDTTVTSGITSSSTSVVVAGVTGFPSQFPFILALDYNTVNEELVSIVGVSGFTLTIGTAVGVASVGGRGINGTTAVAHAAGAVVRHVAIAQDFTDAQTHYDKALSAGAHGVTGALATFLGSTTSANLAATVIDETGSGSLVFGTSPTIATPTITSPSISGPTFTGTITVGGSTGASGQVLSSTGTGVQWSTTAAGYSAPTIGTTLIGSGATIGTINGMTKIQSQAYTQLDSNSYETDITLMNIMGAW